MSILFKAKVLNSIGTITQIGQYLEDGNITEAVDQPPSGRFQFLDRDKYIEHLIGYTDSFPILVEVSTDSGASYSNLFFGDVEDVNLSMDDKGDRHVSFVAYGGMPLRYNLLSPNQVGIGDCDIGAIFTGTPYAYYSVPGSGSNGRMWSVSWGSDSCGNYPNGLLYDTGYELSPNSVVDIAGITDVPIHYGYGSTQILETIDSFLKPYGLSYIIYEYTDPPRFKILSNSALGSWSDNGFLTLSVGKNVSTFNRKIDLTRKRDKMIVISGKDEAFFDIWGTGTFEKLIQDDDIDNYATARSIAKLGMSMSAITPEQWDVTTLPTPNLKYATTSEYIDNETMLLGHSIAFEDVDNTATRKNLIEITQEIGTDRWSTNLRLETPPIELAQTVEEITAQFENIDREKLLGQIYVRAKSVSSSWLLVANALLYPQTVKPVAIGIGSSSEITSQYIWHPHLHEETFVTPDSYLLNPMFLSPLKGTTGDDTTPDTISSCYTQFLTREGVGLIKEIALFGNSQGSLVKISQLMNWNRPTDFVQEETVKATMSDLLSGTWPVSIDCITVVSNRANCSVHQFKLTDATIKKIDWSVSQTPATHTDWDKAFLAPSQDKITLVSEDTLSVYDQGVASFSATGSNYCQMEFVWDYPIGESALASHYMDGLYLYLHGRGTWSNGGSVSNEPVRVYLYTTVGDSWQYWGDLSTSGPSCSITTLTHYDLNDAVNSGGKVRVLLMTSHSHGDGTNSIVLNYGGVNIYSKDRMDDIWYQTGSDQLNFVVEKCHYDWKSGHFKTSLPAWSINGLWLDGYLDQDNIFHPGEIPPYSRKGAQPENFQSNLIEKYKISWAKSNAEDFTMYYDVTELDNPTNNLGDRPVLNNCMFISDVEAKILMKNETAWLSYSTKLGGEIDPPQTLSSDIIKIQYINESNGNRSQAIIDCKRAPIYNNYIKVEYSAVGTQSDDCAGIMARAVMNPTLDSESILREGISKDGQKILNLQFDAAISVSDENSGYAGIINNRLSIGIIEALGEERRRSGGTPRFYAV